MLKKIRTYFAQRKQMKKMLTYYKQLKAGALFVQFIKQDLAEMKKKNLNRKERRRFEIQLEKNGWLSEEMVAHYGTRVEQMHDYIQSRLKTETPLQVLKKKLTPRKK